MLRSLEQVHQEIAANSSIRVDENETKRRKKFVSMTRELGPDQKAIVKMNMSRETTEGVVKCTYCEKEITSKNVDRWASHLRGCPKTPDDVKAQIQPYRPPPMQHQQQKQEQQQQHQVNLTPMPQPVPMMPEATHPGSLVAAAPPNHLGSIPHISSGYNEVFKVHVSKDYMKFNAAHFIAYKVRSIRPWPWFCAVVVHL